MCVFVSLCVCVVCVFCVCVCVLCLCVLCLCVFCVCVCFVCVCACGVCVLCLCVFCVCVCCVCVFCVCVFCVCVLCLCVFVCVVCVCVLCVFVCVLCVCLCVCVCACVCSTSSFEQRKTQTDRFSILRHKVLVIFEPTGRTVFRYGDKTFSMTNRPDRRWGPSRVFLNGHWGSFAGLKRKDCQAEHRPPTCTVPKLRIRGVIPLFPLDAFMACLELYLLACTC